MRTREQLSRDYDSHQAVGARLQAQTAADLRRRWCFLRWSLIAFAAGTSIRVALDATLGASWRNTMLHVQIRSALPGMLTGMRISMAGASMALASFQAIALQFNITTGAQPGISSEISRKFT